MIKTLHGQTASRLGLASQYIEDASCIAAAFDAGINYFFDYGVPKEPLVSELKSQLAVKQNALIYCVGSESRDRTTLRQTLDTTRQQLNLDIIDIFFAEYISPSDPPDEIEATLDELNSLKEQGLIRYVGITTHNRPLGMQLVERCDVLMHRYNMAHRKAEDTLFPAAQAAETPIVAFTCTRWGTLLDGHPDWISAPPTAPDCYRFALRHPAVELALTSPANRAQLAENLKILAFPNMTEAESEHWKAYGDLIYGDGQNTFETRYL